LVFLNPLFADEIFSFTTRTSSLFYYLKLSFLF
jgi:hypothetical protein